jgi:hypothetical protein
MIGKYRAVLLGMLAAAGCAAPAPSQAPLNAGMHSLRFEPVYENASGTPIKSSSLPKEQIFAFRLKPGSLLGGTLFATVDLQRFSSARDKLVIDLDSWMASATRKALPVAGTRVRDGVNIEPLDTRIAQVLPVVYSEGTGRLGGRFLGSHSFFMDEGEQDVDLMFFDRACHLRGTYQPDGARGTVTVDVEIPGPGFYMLSYVAGLGRDKYWLVVSPHANTLSLVTRF